MMIKKYFISILLFVLLFPFLNVNAASMNWDDNSINYEITDFTISDSAPYSISMKGWSFIDHADNYGGKTLTTWIVAYTGSWNNEWYKGGKINQRCTISSSNKCLSYSTVAIDLEDAYYTRCTYGSCTLNWHDKNEAKVRDQNESYIDYCTGNNSVRFADDVDGGRCVYSKIGFQLQRNITIEELEEKFGENTDIKFRIVSRVKVKHKGTDGKKTVYDSANLGFIEDTCKKIFGDACNNSRRSFSSPEFEETTQNEKELSDGVRVVSNVTHKYHYDVTVGGINNTVLFTAYEARRFTSKDGYDADYGNGPNTVFFTTGGTYTINAIGDRKKYSNYKGDETGTFSARRMKLCDSNDNCWWAWTSWFKASGNFTINIRKSDSGTPEYSCENFYCVGGNCDNQNCDYAKPTGLKSESNNSDSTTACSDYDFSADVDKVYDSTSKYYYRVSKEYVKENFGADVDLNVSGSVVKTKGNYYYFPLKFVFLSHITETGNFDIVKGTNSSGVGSGNKFTNNMTVNNGRFFNYAFNYLIKVKWGQDFSCSSTTCTSQYNSYSDVIASVPLRNSRGRTIRVLVSLKKDEDIYKKNGSNYIKVTYNLDLYKDLIKAAMSPVSNTISATVTFSDSNDFSKTIDNGGGNSSAGTFSRVSYSPDPNSNGVWDEGEEISASYTYRINQAYYKNNGDGYGNYSYDSLKATDGNYNKSERSYVYFIPVDLRSGEVFKFKVESDKLSLVNGINFTYNATCNVNVNNVLKKVKYRTINVADPFPNGGSDCRNCPLNWKEYYNVVKNFNRINNTFISGPISYQTVLLNSSVKSTMDDLNTSAGAYNSYKDIDKDGNSSVTRSSIFEIKSGKHCESGSFDSDCDKVT